MAAGALIDRLAASKVAFLLHCFCSLLLASGRLFSALLLLFTSFHGLSAWSDQKLRATRPQIYSRQECRLGVLGVPAYSPSKLGLGFHTGGSKIPVLKVEKAVNFL
jgi:hypothetical protein